MAREMKDFDAEEELIGAFKVFDRDGNGFISAAALCHGMTNLGEQLTEEEVDKMIREADVDGDDQIFQEHTSTTQVTNQIADGNGTIGCQESPSSIARKMKNTDTDEELIGAFEVFNRDGNVFICAAKLSHVTTNLGEKLTDDDVDGIIREAGD